MSILRFLGMKEGSADHAPETETVRKITQALDRLDPKRAQYIASCAYLLGRVAYADLNISEEETDKMERIISEHMGLPAEQAVIAVQIAKTQARMFGGTEDYLVAREFAHTATREEKIDLLHCLFAVCASDRNVSVAEESEIKKIASELRLERQEFLDVRLKYREHLAVLKDEPRKA